MILGSVVSSGRREYWKYRNRDGFCEARTDRLPRLLTDVSVIMRHDARTGIQRVVRSFWSKLLERSGVKFDVVPVFATKTHGYRFARPNVLQGTLEERQLGHTVTVQPGDKFFGLDLSVHLMPYYEQQIASWRSHGATTHLVVYDLLPLRHPQWFNGKTTQNFRRWIEIVRSHCDQALCISDDVANELRAELGTNVRNPSISRIHLAGDIESSWPSSGLRDDALSVLAAIKNRPAILMVGTVEPRKGYDAALAAFANLWRSADGPILIIVGKEGWKTKRLQQRILGHREYGRRLFWLRDASDEALARLYNECSAVLLSSRGEGFGLPAIEAAHYRRWALVRNLPVFTEQQLPNLCFFTDDSPNELSNAVVELLRNAKAGAPPTPELASWSSCVDRLIGVMDMCNPRKAQSAI